MLPSLTAGVCQLMGLAVYNSIALDIHFPLCCYRLAPPTLTSPFSLTLVAFPNELLRLCRKLLTPPTAPCDQNAVVGVATASLDDLQQIMPVGAFCELDQEEGGPSEV